MRYVCKHDIVTQPQLWIASHYGQTRRAPGIDLNCAMPIEPRSLRAFEPGALRRCLTVSRSARQISSGSNDVLSSSTNSTASNGLVQSIFGTRPRYLSVFTTARPLI